MDSWREGTRRQYQCYIDKWVEYCAMYDVDMFDPSISQVLDYLLNRFETGIAYSTVNTIRSALSSFIMKDGKPIGQHYLVARFMKAVQNRRPYIPKTLVVWDVNMVLKYLATVTPAHKIPISLLSKKLVLLMAILAGVRGQLLYLIDVVNMTITRESISFRIAELTKTSKAGKHVPELKFQTFLKDKRLDVVHYAKIYLRRTLNRRWTKTSASSVGSTLSSTAVPSS